jgi:glycosyltransferase involved in cell wall biosynthesis
MVESASFMRIGINATLLSKQRLGVASYIFSLVRGLSRIDKANEYFVFTTPDGRSELSLNAGNFQTIIPEHDISSSLSRILWEQTGLINETKRLKLDILHNPDHALPVFSTNSRTIMTVHDLAFLKFPKTFSIGKRIYKQLITKTTIKKADSIIAVSNSTRDDLIELFDIPRNRIHVIYEGIDGSCKPVTDRSFISKVNNKYGLAKDFILFVGAIEPRKNIPMLLKAFQRLRSEKGFALDLVIAGGKGWLSQSVFDTARNLGIEDSVKFLGYVQKDELAVLYSIARVFAYPSLYEGFGFPPLEAMSCGAPVIVSNVSSLPEVVGDAALKIDPRDEGGLADAILKITTDDKLRAGLIKKGFERVKFFSWEKCARETLKVYEGVLRAKDR